MKNTLFCFLFLLLAGNQSLLAQNIDNVKMRRLIDDQFRFAESQYKILAKNVPSDVMPKTYNVKTGKVETSDTKWWCSGFYPGSLMYIYEYTRDTATLSEVNRRLAILENEKHYTGNHDLGFMMFCSFGNAYRILKDEKFKAIIDTSASSLATRYRPAAGVIQSWNSSKTWKGPVIIDNMMNLELLYWVSEHGGDSKYKQIAISHANNTLKNHFRSDYSSYHVVDYDMSSGKVIRKGTAQGASDESAWSRGQGWALYGYTMMYRFTKDKKYLDQAIHIANFILNHPNLPADGVPYWDFNAPGIPDTYRDVSAGAIISSALLELGQYSNGKNKARFISEARKMIVSLSSGQYRSKPGENGGFILSHSVGALPLKSEIDVPLTYADYYFLEALARYKKWYL